MKLAEKLKSTLESLGWDLNLGTLMLYKMLYHLLGGRTDITNGTDLMESKSIAINNYMSKSLMISTGNVM